MSRSGFYALKLSGITSGRRGLEQRARCGRRPSEILTNPSTTDCTRYRGRRAATIIDFEPQPRIHVDTDLEILRGWQGRNVLGGYDLPWEVVRSIQFGRGAPWATLELQDDDVVSMMAVQAADKAYAVATVRALRALLATHQQAGTPAAD